MLIGVLPICRPIGGSASSRTTSAPDGVVSNVILTFFGATGAPASIVAGGGSVAPAEPAGPAEPADPGPPIATAEPEPAGSVVVPPSPLFIITTTATAAPPATSRPPSTSGSFDLRPAVAT